MAGRPTKNLDKELFEEMCQLHMSQLEMSRIFRCDENTINAWCNRTYSVNYSEIFPILSQGGKMSLRRKQFKVAMSGNPSMLIWLDKQWLGGKDQVHETHVLSKELMDDFEEAITCETESSGH